MELVGSPKTNDVFQCTGGKLILTPSLPCVAFGLKANSFQREFSICVSAQCLTVLRKCFCSLNPLLLFQRCGHFLMFYFLHRCIYSEQLDTCTCSQFIIRHANPRCPGSSTWQTMVRQQWSWRVTGRHDSIKGLAPTVHCSYFEANDFTYPKT